jgi:4-hydroxythreonine-4-phosphate dehydrogenase
VEVFGARAGLDLLAGGPLPFAWSGPDLALEGRIVPWTDPAPDLPGLRLGTGSAGSGRAAVEGVRAGARRVLEGGADALVTLPLSKAAAHAAGFPIPGHTEFLQELSGAPATRMAFVSPSFSVVLHTVHQSLRSVVEGLRAGEVAETLAFSARRFRELAGTSGLRVALCALNPHAGEGGAFGDEERLLEEALDRARARLRDPDPAGPSPFPPGPPPAGWELHPGKAWGPGEGITFSGPHPSDTLFLRTWRGEFDLVVALYHDQGLIPIKVLEPERAVNLTLGLPFVRTSPDHGTAFGIAGRFEADPANFIQAAELAIRLARRVRADR